MDAKRGRPSGVAKQPAWMLFRILIVLEAYNRARSTGETHVKSMHFAAKAFREKFPGKPVSESCVRRILLEHQPRERSEVIEIRRLTGAEMLEAEKSYPPEILGGRRIKFSLRGVRWCRQDYPRAQSHGA